MQKAKMRSFQYEKHANGMYVLRDTDGKMVLKTMCPAILFDRDSGTLHKHGDFDLVRKTAAEMRAKYARVGAKDMAVDLVVYASKNFNLEELNKCLAVSDYCKTFMEKMSKQ